jgi:hypothetical protein
MNHWAVMADALDDVLANCSFCNLNWPRWEREERCFSCKLVFNARDHASDFAAEEQADREHEAAVDAAHAAFANQEIEGSPR